MGINVAKSTVERYRPRVRKPPSPTWKAFLKNHVKDLISCDFFTVPTVTYKVVDVSIERLLELQIDNSLPVYVVLLRPLECVTMRNP